MLRPAMMMLLILATLVALAGGCAATHPTDRELTIEPGQYATAFAASRQALRDERWTIERVDARAGIITTRTTYTASLTGPADRQLASTLSSPDDLLNRQQRLIRITFEPATPGVVPPDDLAEFDGPLTLRVRAVRLRVQDPGWRVPTTSVRHSSRAIDPELIARGMSPDYAVALNVDEELSAQLAALIANRMTTPIPATPEPTKSDAEPMGAPASEPAR